MSFDNVLHDPGLPVINCKRDIAKRKIFDANGLDMKAIQNEIDSLKSPNSMFLTNASAAMEIKVEPVKVTTDNILGFLEGTDPVLE